MRTFAVCVLAITLLTGCTTIAERREIVASSARVDCNKIYEYGTPQYEQCVAATVAAWDANRQASGFALMGLGAAILTQPRPAPAYAPLPQQCSSYVNGQYISTRCW